MSLLDRLLPTRQDSMIFEATQKCNLDCLYCYNVWKGARPYPRGELDTPGTLRLLDRILRETRCRQVTLTGGEPLLRKDLMDLVRFLRRRRVGVGLISNGTLLTEERVRELISAGVSLFELPLLSSDRTVHDGLVGQKGSYDRVVEAISWIKVCRGDVVTVFVGTRRNLPGIAEAIELSIALGVNGLMFNRFNPGGEGSRHIDELLPGIVELKEALATADRLARRYRYSIACSIPIQPCLIDTSEFPNLGFGMCAAGTKRAYYTVDPLGNVRACNHTPTILGNILETTPFRRLVRSEGVRSLAGAAPPACDGCVLRASCRGGCPAAAEACYGKLDCEDPLLRASPRRPLPAAELKRRAAASIRGAD